MAITTALTTSFKRELMEAKHNFLAAGNTFKLALIKPAAAGTYGAASTNYSDITGNSDEASGSGYSSGGAALTSVDPTTSGTTAYGDFNDLTFSTVTLSAIGSMIYNSTNGNRAVILNDFGATYTATAGDFTIVFPAPAAATAIIRLA